MKKTFAFIIIVTFAALVVSQALPASANLANPNNSMRGAVGDQLIGVNITPIIVKSGGTITATGYVQWWCSSACNPPGWQPNGGMEVHFDQVTNGSWYIMANGTTDSNGYFSLQCQAPTTPGIYQYGILMPRQGLDAGVFRGPWVVTVY